MGVNNDKHYKFLLPQSIQDLSDEERLSTVRAFSKKYIEFMNKKINKTLKKEIDDFLKEVKSPLYGNPFHYLFPEYIHDEMDKDSAESFLQIIPESRDKRNLASSEVNVVFPDLGFNVANFPRSRCWVDVYV